VTLDRVGNDFTGQVSVKAAGEGSDLRGGSVVTVNAKGDLRLGRVESSGAISVTSAGAIYDTTNGAEPANIKTSNSLTLNAARGIGAFGPASLRVSASEVQVTNTQSGDIVLAGVDKLIANSVRNDAPNGWVVLLSGKGAIEPGKLEAKGGRTVILTGKTSISQQEAQSVLSLLSRSSGGESGFASSLPNMNNSSGLMTSTDSVLSAGVQAVREGLLGSASSVSISQIIAPRSVPAPLTSSSLFVGAQMAAAPAIVPVSSVLAPVSTTPGASQAVQANDSVARTPAARGAAGAAGGGGASDTAPAQTAPAQVSPGPSGPAQPVPGSAVPAQSVPGQPVPDPSAPADAAPADAPAAPAPVPGSGDSPGSERDRSGSSDAGASVELSGVSLGSGLRHRISAVYRGITERLMGMFDREQSSQAVTVTDEAAVDARAFSHVDDSVSEQLADSAALDVRANQDSPRQDSGA
jgi:hypothetical protein